MSSTRRSPCARLRTRVTTHRVAMHQAAAASPELSSAARGTRGARVPDMRHRGRVGWRWWVVLVVLTAGCDADSRSDVDTSPVDGSPGHTSRVYDPYPPGLLPADLPAEIDRVNAEV